MKRLLFLTILLVCVSSIKAKTLIAYYSFTGNSKAIATELQSQITADMLEIQPAEEGLDYAANNYALGSSLISAIKANPDSESSYPVINEITTDLSRYNTVIIVTPLWWSQMAAPMQTFLFKNASALANKNIGLIVSSHSSGISGVESDAKRLLPNGKFMSKSLWINYSNLSKKQSLIESWLKTVYYTNISSDVAPSDTLSFTSLQRTFAGTTLCYRKANLSDGTNGSKALVIYLHGGSSCGTDNETQMKEAGIDSISNYLVRKGMNATFVVPQCPDRTKGWGGIAGSVKALLDFTIRTDVIDSTRIYIFGGSMGGTGTWKILSTYPNYFAAGMPCAANPTGMNATNVATTPVLNVMGLADMIMDADVRATAESFITQLKSLGDDAKYETVEGWTHEITCIQSYTTDRLDWVFAHQRKADTSVQSVTVNDVNNSEIYDLQGRRLSATPNQGMYIENGIKKAK